jgi:Replication-relaxation
MESMIGVRLKRFERTPDGVALRVTERDIEIIRHVARFRFLSSRQIGVLVGDAGRVPRRLQSLFHNGYLDRPKAQLVYYGASGSERMVYGLGAKGAALLAERDGTSTDKLRWTQKNKEAKQLFIKHTVAVADVLITLERACTPETGLRFVGEDEILEFAPDATQRMKNPTKVSARVIHKGKPYDLSIVPDAIFSLVETDGDKRKQYNFFLELDTGTMPITRKAASLTTLHRQTSLMSKFLTYAQAHADRQMRERFGWGSFRVLVVTGEGRVASINGIVANVDFAQVKKLIHVSRVRELGRVAELLGSN